MGTTTTYCGTTEADLPDDLDDYLFAVATNRNVAIYGNLIIDNSADDYRYGIVRDDGLAGHGRRRSSTTVRIRPTGLRGPIVANGRVVSGVSCMTLCSAPEACVITAHDVVDGDGAVALADDPIPRRCLSATRNGAAYVIRAARARWCVDRAELRSGAGERTTSQRRFTSPAPKFLLGGSDIACSHRQLDPRTRRRHGRDLGYRGVTAQCCTFVHAPQRPGMARRRGRVHERPGNLFDPPN